MKERPILFSGEMVRAILDGRKTQTRRIVKPQPYEDRKLGVCWEPKGKNHPTGSPWYCARNANWNPITNAFADFYRDRGGSPYGVAGHRLWVRETFCDDFKPFIYRASSTSTHYGEEKIKWKPSIFMKRISSRITLEITKVRVERLQDISKEDASAEGVACRKCNDRGTYLEQFADNHLTACQDCVRRAEAAGHRISRGQFVTTDTRKTYSILWDSINGKWAWEKNPWVWCIEFQKV